MANLTSVLPALLWESWSLTRAGILIRLTIILLFMTFCMVVYETRPLPTEEDLRGLKALLNFIALCGLASVYGIGQTGQGERGFPFRQNFTRPLPIAWLVVVPLLYRAVAYWLIFVIPLTLIHLLYGVPQYLFYTSLLIYPSSLLLLAGAWWTSDSGLLRLVTWVVIALIISALLWQTMGWEQPPDDIDVFFASFAFTAVDYLLIVGASALAISMAVVGGKQQRQGEPGGFWAVLDNSKTDQGNWFEDLYLTECPTTSPGRAELWAETNARGMPALVWSAVAAALLPTLWLVSNLLDSEVLWWSGTYAVLIAPLVKTSPNLGVYTRSGVTSISVFEETHPMDIGWLALMKVGVATLSLLGGVTLITLSLWLSMPLTDNFIEVVALLRLYLIDYVRDATPLTVALAVFVRLVQLVSLITLVAVLQATYAIYTDRITISLFVLAMYVWLLPLAIFADVLPVWAGFAHLWAVTGVLVLAAFALSGSVIRRNILSPTGLAGLLLSWALYACAYAFLLVNDGTIDSATPLSFIALRASICLSTLVIFIMAPWSMGITRHQ